MADGPDNPFPQALDYTSAPIAALPPAPLGRYTCMPLAIALLQFAWITWLFANAVIDSTFFAMSLGHPPPTDFIFKTLTPPIVGVLIGFAMLLRIKHEVRRYQCAFWIGWFGCWLWFGWLIYAIATSPR